MTELDPRVRKTVLRWLAAAELPVVILEQNGTIRFCNEAWAGLAGCRSEQAVGQSLLSLFCCDPESRLPEALQSASQPETAIETVTLHRPTPELETRWSELWLTVLPECSEQRLLLGVQRDITLQQRDQARQQIKAGQDSLTGLLNREQFLQDLGSKLATLQTSRSGLAVVFLDLDNFKPVNDNYGHAVGDLLLAQLGARLRAAVRTSDLVARFGGDEFVLALFGITTAEQAQEMTERLFANLFTPLTLPDGAVHQPSASAGVAFTTDSEIAPETLIENADAAMYRAKRGGRQQVALGDTLQTHSGRLARDQFEEALSRGDIELYFQPVLALKQQLTIGFEVLPYWQHAERGLLEPDAFQEFIDHSPAGQAFNRWLINEAAQHSAWFKHQGYDIGMGINMTRAQIETGSFIDTLQEVRGYFSDNQVDLTLEIVETIQFQDSDLAFSVLEHAREIGCQVVLDDFGTGASSMTFAARVPLDFIKLHPSVVRGLDRRPEKQRLVTGIIRFAHELGHRVLASGVRSQQEADILEQLGCDMIQGHLLDPPMDIQQVMSQFVDPAGNPRFPLRRFDL